MKTPAAILVELRKDLAIDEIEVPVIGLGHVLVEIHATRICGSQLGEIDGAKGEDRYLPHLLGHEAGGVVLETGPGVTHVKEGDRVVCHWRPGRGLALKPPIYDWNGRKVNSGHITTFQRLAVIAENRLTVVPQDADFEVCCLLADTLTTGFGVVNNNARLKIGESAVVIGVGGIGLGALLGAKIAGAHPLIAVDQFAHKLDKARELGATHTLQVPAQSLQEARTLLGGPADVVIDCTGRPEVLAEAYDLAGPKGRIVGIGVMRHDQKLSINTLPLHLGRILTGSHGGESDPFEDIPRYLRMIRDGRLPVAGMISHRCELPQINEAIARMRSGESIHTIIHFRS